MTTLASVSLPRNCGKDYTKKNYHMMCTSCDGHIVDNTCQDCSIDYALTEDYIFATIIVKPALPTMNLVLNLCGGEYDSTTNISAHMRALDMCVIDVDNNPIYGGGSSADLTANSVFDFLLLLVRSKRVIGVVAAQPCGSGSVVRL